MSINLASLFFTPQAGQGALPGHQALSGGGIPGMPGAGFIDLILAQIATGDASKDETMPENGKEHEKNHEGLTGVNLLLHRIAHAHMKPESEKTTELASPDYDVNALPLDSAVPQEAIQPPLPANDTDLMPDHLSDASDTVNETDILKALDTYLKTGEIPSFTADEATGTGEPIAETPLPEALPPEAIAKAQNKFLSFLRHLLEGIPVESRPEAEKIHPGLLRRIVHDLTFTPKPAKDIPAADINNTAHDIPAAKPVPTEITSETSEPAPSPALIAAGLTPEKITEFIEELKRRTEAGESFIVGLVKILPPEAKREFIFLPRALVFSKTAAAPRDNAAANAGMNGASGIISPPVPSDNPEFVESLAAQLNALTTGGTEDGLILPEHETGFDRVLRVLEQAQTRAADTQNGAPGLEKAINNALKHAGAGLSSFSGNPSSPASIAFSNASFEDIFPEGFDWSRMPGGAAHGMGINTPAMMASLIGQAQSAAQPHPAAQTVAATIAKVAASGETKNVTIKLDPPDLGRVEIRMEFSKDKIAKVHLAVEKQETYLMLQRDAHVLDKTLQEIGMDADGGLSFELAQDGNMFEDDGRGGENAGGGSSGRDGNPGEETIIEATVNWHIDPETGLTRYDILA
ncbi:MAG: flagellar hook-length control protein FliK [Proteobacteria bacterium]|nr:flagellar hook-length control protein FliK [Pseudomonadota bacterium]